VALADVAVAFEPFVPVTAVPNVAAVDDVCPEVPPELVLAVAAPVSAPPFEPSLQAATTTGVSESSKPRRRDFIGRCATSEDRWRLSGVNVPTPRSAFSTPRNTHATKIRCPAGAINMEGFLARSHAAPLPLGRQMDQSPGRSPLSGAVSRGRPKYSATLSA